MRIRQKLLIDPPFQLCFLAYTIGIAVIISAIFFAANRYFFWEFTQQGKALSLPANHAFFLFLDSQRKTLDLVILLASLTVVAVLTVYGLYLSNRVAGPIHRLKKHLEEYQSSNQFSDFQFRKNDFFPELAQSVNESIRHTLKNSSIGAGKTTRDIP